MEHSEPSRLEDFISLVRRGKYIKLTIDLRKEIVTPTVRPDRPEEYRKGDMYLLWGEYSFSVAGEVRKVSKIYAFGTFKQSEDLLRRNMNIANERIKMDYRRLKAAPIEFEEKFF